MDELTSFLYELLGGPTKPWPKAERAHDVLKRRKAVVEALNTLKDLGWSRSCGGYEIPEGKFPDDINALPAFAECGTV